MCQYYVKLLLVLFYNNKLCRPYSTLSFVLLHCLNSILTSFLRTKINDDLINFTFKILTSVALINNPAPQVILPDSDLAVLFLDPLTTEFTL